MVCLLRYEKVFIIWESLNMKRGGVVTLNDALSFQKIKPRTNSHLFSNVQSFHHNYESLLPFVMINKL